MLRAWPLTSRTWRLGLRTSGGFSLLELLGVLAIAAIVTAISAPVVIRQRDRAAYTKEFNDLNAISNAFVLQAISTKSIPDQTTWSNKVANWVMRPASQITTNPRRFNRVFLMNSNLTLAPLILPYLLAEERRLRYGESCVTLYSTGLN